MPDTELTEAFERFVNAVQYRGWKRMLTGRRIDATTVTLSGAPPGKVWVRGGDESREQTAVWGSASRYNAGVVVGPGFDGADEIKTLDYEQAVASLGDAARWALVLPPNETIPSSIPGNSFVPGRVEASQDGALLVHVRGFWHAGGYWDDSATTADPPTLYDFDLSGEGGSASGYSAWVVVYFDPADEALHAVTGADVFGDPAVLNELDLADVVLPSGVIPVGAVGIANGQTEITGSSRFADQRIFLGRNSLVAADIPDLSATYQPIAVASVNTTNATVTTLATIATASNMSYVIEATIAARRTGGAAGAAGDSAGYVLAATFKNVAGTVTQIGATSVLHSAEDQAGWDCAFDVSGTNVRVRVTGAIDNSVSWRSVVRVNSV